MKLRRCITLTLRADPCEMSVPHLLGSFWSCLGAGTRLCQRWTVQVTSEDARAHLVNFPDRVGKVIQQVRLMFFKLLGSTSWVYFRLLPSLNPSAAVHTAM